MKGDRVISDILITAAKDMERLYYTDTPWFLACCARIESAAWGKIRFGIGVDWVFDANKKANDFFAELFMPENKTWGDLWFGDPYSKKSAEHRMLALYFAAHIAYSEGL